MKCLKCNLVTQTKTQPIPILNELSFITERVEGQFCIRCNEFNYDRTTVWFLSSYFKKWIYWEHTGMHVRKRFNKKHHFIYHPSLSSSLLGEAPKGIYSNPIDNQKWRIGNHSNLYLFKGPKIKNSFCHGFRETMSEVIMNHLAQKLVRTATASVGNYKGKLVFITKIFTNHNEQLIHGTEIFKELYDDEGIQEIQKDRNAQRKFYSVEHIEEALFEFAPDFANELIKSFYNMLLVDAWLGNQDRHAENWGLKKVIYLEGNEVRYEFAPIFDTARGLFWNESIVILFRRYVHNQDGKQLQKYIDSSCPLMSLDNVENANHFEIAKYIKNKDSRLFNKFLISLNAVDIQGAISLYSGTLHPKRLELICELLQQRRKVLNNI